MMTMNEVRPMGRFMAADPVPTWHQPSMYSPHHIRYGESRFNSHPAYYPKERREKKRPAKAIPIEERHLTVDVIGNGRETTICGHIDLLCLLPLHHSMHRELLETFKKKPGNYEGKYKEPNERKASVVNYGNGYLAVHFTDDITRPEMSEFLLGKGWKMMNAHCTVQNGSDMIYEKWTNVLTKHKASQKQIVTPSTMQRYY